MTRLLFSIGLLLFTAVAQGADIAGNWTGTIDIKDESSGTDISTPVKFHFIQTGDVVSGTVGRQEDSELVPIKNVKLEGTKISFEASNGETSQPVRFVLTIAGDRMEGEMKTALDQEQITGKVKIARAKG
jgi:hypothetical protein